MELDEVGLIKADENLMTNIPGVFVAGDIRSHATMQIASAAGEGATAALKIREYLEGREHAPPELKRYCLQPPGNLLQLAKIRSCV